MTRTERIKRIQRAVGAKDDGKIGPQTLGKIEAALQIGAIGTPVVVIPPGDKVDSRSAKNIATLQPEVRPMFTALCLAGKKIGEPEGIDYKIISGTRTYEEQDALYAKGRTKPGRIVTNARAGFSNHNFGIATDGGWFRDGEYLDSTEPETAARLNKELADWAKERFGGEIEWGGDWRRFKDFPHFTYDNGLTLAQMRARVEKGQAIV